MATYDQRREALDASLFFIPLLLPLFSSLRQVDRERIDISSKEKENYSHNQNVDEVK